MKNSAFAIVMLSFIFFSCKKDKTNENTGLPVITTLSLSSITSTTGVGGGDISSEGSSTVTARGVCWSVSADPDITASHTSDGSGPGTFSSNLSQLVPGTTYHVRAYASNSAGTSYGDDISFNSTAQNVYALGGQFNGTNFETLIWKNGVANTINLGTTVNATDIFVQGVDVYLVGQESIAGGAYVARIWKNGTASFLSANTTTQGSGESIAISGTDVYVAGFEINGTTEIPVLWKNGVATTLPNTGVNTRAHAVAVSGTDVYVCGSGGYAALLWKNGVAVNLTSGNVNAYAYNIFASGTDVYVAGSVYNGSNFVATIWKNGTPVNLTDGSNEARATAVAVSGADVYVTGIENNGTHDVVKLWKNGVAEAVTDGTSDSNTYSMCVSGNDVYIPFNELNSTTGIVIGKIWKNGVTTTMTDGIYDGSVSTVFVQ